MGTVFLQYELIEPQESTVQPGPIFNFNVRRVMGSNPMLARFTISLREAATSNHLHFFSPGNDRALRLYGLIELRDTPQPACYFFNRIEHSSSHFVSYEFAQSPVMDASDTSEIIQNLVAEFSKAD